jgi:hypothetical protein
MSGPSATIELSKAWMSEELTMRALTEELKDLESLIVGGHPDLPAGGHEEDPMAITERDRIR